jgi:uncharacterized protein (TIRG00374 family)
MPRWITGRRLLLAATVAVTLLAVVSAFHDLPAVGRALQGFDWQVLPAAVVISLIMHGLRFVRWHLYVGRVASAVLPAGQSLLIYGAGMGTHLTPGRAGEAVRCAFLRQATETPVARSAPIMLAERLTDAVGLLGLALPGMLLLGLGGPATLAIFAGLLLLLPVFASRRVHRMVIRISRRMPFAGRHTHAIEEAAEELRGLLTPRLLVAGTVLSVASVALEVAVFALVLKGLGLELDWETYVRAAFVLPAAMLASAVFIVPGNLGVAEGGLAALTRATLAVPAAGAAGAAVLVRLCTLWLGLAVGWPALAIATRRWGAGRTQGAGTGTG